MIPNVSPGVSKHSWSAGDGNCDRRQRHSQPPPPAPDRARQHGGNLPLGFSKTLRIGCRDIEDDVHRPAAAGRRHAQRTIGAALQRQDRLRSRPRPSVPSVRPSESRWAPKRHRPSRKGRHPCLVPRHRQKPSTPVKLPASPRQGRADAAPPAASSPPKARSPSACRPALREHILQPLAAARRRSQQPRSAPSRTSASAAPDRRAHPSTPPRRRSVHRVRLSLENGE